MITIEVTFSRRYPRTALSFCSVESADDLTCLLFHACYRTFERYQPCRNRCISKTKTDDLLPVDLT